MSTSYEQLSTNLEARIDNILNMDWLQTQQTPSLFTFGSTSPLPRPVQTYNTMTTLHNNSPVQPTMPVIFGSPKTYEANDSGPKFPMAVVVISILIGILIVLVGFIIYNLMVQKEPTDEVDENNPLA